MRKIKHFFYKYFYETPRACILCLRFPFLYPRNNYTDLHYNSWALMGYIKGLKEKYFVHRSFKDDGTVKYNHTVTNIADLCYESFWINKWAPILCNFLDWVHRHPVQWFTFIPTYSMLDIMPDGWRKAFGVRMCEDLKKELKSKHLLRQYRIEQLKEKYGELRWYDRGGTTTTNKIIDMYEYLSRHYCIVCGKLATKTTTIEQYASPYCDKHFPKYCINYKEFGTKGNPWFNYEGNIHFRAKDEWELAEKNSEEYLKGFE